MAFLFFPDRNTFILSDNDSPKDGSQEDRTSSKGDGDSSECYTESDLDSPWAKSPMDVKSQHKISSNESLSENKVESEETLTKDSEITESSKGDKVEIVNSSKDENNEDGTPKSLKDDKVQAVIARASNDHIQEDFAHLQQESKCPTVTPSCDVKNGVQTAQIQIELKADKDALTDSNESENNTIISSGEPSPFIPTDPQSLASEEQSMAGQTTTKTPRLPSLKVTLPESPLSPSILDSDNFLTPGMSWLQFSPGECLSAQCSKYLNFHNYSVLVSHI